MSLSHFKSEKLYKIKIINEIKKFRYLIFLTKYLMPKTLSAENSHKTITECYVYMYIFILFYFCSRDGIIISVIAPAHMFSRSFFFIALAKISMFKKKIRLGVLAIIITDDCRLFVGS